MTFEVWAPNPRKVTLLLDRRKHPMTSTADGWWTAEVPAPADADYGYLLDDDPAVLPDPRSRRQPDTVHGLSRTFDPSGFAWTDSGWRGRQLAGAVIYELHVGTFTEVGTLDSAIGRLDHLVTLGVDFVELLPVNAFNGTRNWGYDGVLWYAVQESYGGPAAYQRFVDACHARGLGVVQDVVYNHLGPSGNYLPRFGPYLNPGSSTLWGESIDLAEPAVRDYIVQNAMMWFRDYHVDGLRLDAVHALVDDSPKHLLQELAEQTDALAAFLGRPLTLIAESDLNDPKLVTPREGGGYGLTAQWSDDFHHAVHVALTGETTGYYADFASLTSLEKVLTHGFFHDGTYSSFRGRNHGHPIDIASMPGWRLVVCSQNHDQVGNRARGDRLSETLDYGRLAVAAALTLTGPFTPMLFMGEEWAASSPWQFFTSHPEPELGRIVAEGRGKEFERMGWDPSVVPDPQAMQTFERSKLVWSEVEIGEHARVLAFYRALIRLRRTRPEFTDPRLWRVEVSLDAEAGWLAVRRGSVSTLVNFSAEVRKVPFPGELLLASHDEVATDALGTTLIGHSAAVVLG